MSDNEIKLWGFENEPKISFNGLNTETIITKGANKLIYFNTEGKMLAILNSEKYDIQIYQAKVYKDNNEIIYGTPLIYNKTLNINEKPVGLSILTIKTDEIFECNILIITKGKLIVFKITIEKTDQIIKQNIKCS